METNNKIAFELQKRLMQTCIDYINEIGDEHIEEVSFRADSLQCSSKKGEWQPDTDSYCCLYGIRYEDCGNDIFINEGYLIGESY